MSRYSAAGAAMIREAIADFFRPKAQERFLGPGALQFFDNHLGPIRWIGPQDGVEANHSHAFQLAAFHACVRVIAESVAQLPFHLIRQNGDDRERAASHHLYDLVHRRPNPWQSAYEMVEQHVQHVAVWGNAYLYKRYDSSGRVAELWPLHPSQVVPQQLVNNAIVYDYMPTIPDEARRFTDDQIIHTRYLSDNGFAGMVPVSLAAHVIEQARSMDLYASRFWRNDARPGVILETSQPVPQEALVKLRQQWEQLHRGVENAGRTAVLPNGVTAKQMPPISNEASSWAEIRTFCVEEVARQMRVPGSLVGLRTTYANSEQEALNWLQCIVPWCRRIESSFSRGLLGDLQGYSFQLDVRGMLRGDSAARASYYRELFALGVLSPSEIRQLEDMPRLDKPGMDEHYIPVNNFAPVGTPPAPEPAPEPPAPEPAVEEVVADD